MATPHQTAWTQITERVRCVGTVPELDPWLSDTVLLELTDTDAVIGTPNVFVRDAVALYATVLTTAISAITGQTVEVTVVIDGWT